MGEEIGQRVLTLENIRHNQYVAIELIKKKTCFHGTWGEGGVFFCLFVNKLIMAPNALDFLASLLIFESSMSWVKRLVSMPSDIHLLNGNL